MSGTGGLFLLPAEYDFIQTIESRDDFRIKRWGLFTAEWERVEVRASYFM